LARAEPRRIEHHFATYLAVLRPDGGDTPARDRKSGHRHPFGNAGPGGARPPGIGLRQRVRIYMSVRGDPGGAEKPRCLDQREQFSRLRRPDQLDGKAVGAAEGGGALQLLPTRLRGGEPQAAYAAPADILSGLTADPGEEGGAILHQPREVRFGAELAHEAGGVPGRARRQRPLFEEQHVLLARLGELVGDAAANRAAADDDDPRMGRQF
jgi:hypothetical protein